MGFIQSFDKSLFNKDIYVKAGGNDKKNGYATIRIKPSQIRTGTNESNSKDPEVVGVIQNNIEYSLNPQWDELGGIATSVLPSSLKSLRDPYDIATNVVNLGGLTGLGSAFASKLIYRKSGYLELKPQIMIVDWNSDGSPLFAAYLLSFFCLPINLYNLRDEGKSLGDYLEDSSGFKKLRDFLEGNDYEKAVEFLDKLPSGVDTGVRFIQAMGDVLGFDNEDFDDMLSLRASPPPVTIEVGDYFRKTDMVITSLNFSFSREVTKMGPLYLKVDLGLKSRRILRNVDDAGLVGVKASNRIVNLTGNGNIFPEE